MSNRLARETSPYLLQHKNNPVDWYPWGDEALERAVSENKPIILSIGYSACHWCHVMEHESFENPQIAQLMNENFVAIKVDREERPDLDHIYQNVAQAITRTGGWPLTVFLTPDLKPYFGGTYFPPEDRSGRPGFPRVLAALAEAYKTDPEGVAENARKLTDFIGSIESVPPTASRAPTREELSSVAQAILEKVDFQNGGLVGAPKFPNPMLFSFLWRAGVAFKEDRCKEAVLLTLTKMASGGIYDQLGGGFHRYSVDARWSVPHFEKMLYDNGLLLKLYAEVLMSGDPALTPRHKELFTSVLVETCNYIHSEMTSPIGLFYCAQDADSEGEEGKFFVWDPEDLRVALTPTEATVFALKYGVRSGGNFENGETVLHRALPVLEVARQVELSETEVRALLDSARAKLKAVRNRRIAPATDDKTLASWNGLMLSGLAWSSQALRHRGHPVEAERAATAAHQAFRAIREKFVTPEGRLWSTFQGGQGKQNAYLDDYAFLAMAALDLARISTDSVEIAGYLANCRSWLEVILKHFSDAEGIGYFFTSDDHEMLIQRPKTVFDQAIPAGVSVAVTSLLALQEMDWGGRGSHFGQEAEKQLAALFPVATANPFGFGELFCAALLWTQGPVVVSGIGSREAFRHPHLFQQPPKAEQGTSLLVCHRQTCSLALEDADALWRESGKRLEG